MPPPLLLAIMSLQAEESSKDQLANKLERHKELLIQEYDLIERRP